MQYIPLLSARRLRRRAHFLKGPILHVRVAVAQAVVEERDVRVERELVHGVDAREVGLELGLYARGDVVPYV